MAPEISLEEFFSGRADARACFDAVVDRLGECRVRATKSQVAFSRRRGFAWIWVPGQWLAHPRTGTVLSFALEQPLTSPRLAEVVHPAPTLWMHHLDLAGPGDVDEEVAEWLARAYDEAG